MKEAFKKQMIAGIAGVAATVLVAVAAYQFWGIPENRWITYAALAVLMGCFLGSLWITFGGARSFLSGAGYGVGFVALTVSAKELPSWAFGILIVAAVLFFIVRPFVKQYKRDREKDSPAVIDKKAAEEVPQEEAAETVLAEEDEAFKRSIAFGERSLLLIAGTGGMYQLIRGKDALYFIRVGGELSGLDTVLLRTELDDEAALLQGKKDFRLRPQEIVAIRCRYGRTTGTPFENCGRLTIKTDRKQYGYTILETLPPKQLKAFFSDLPFTITTKKQADVPVRPLSEAETRILPTLKKACLALTVSALVVAAVFLFLPVGRVVYRILSALCMLIPVITGVLYAKFNTLLSVEDKNRDEPTFKKTGVNVLLPLLIPSGALMIRTIYDFTVTDWPDFFIWSGALGAVILLLLFAFTTEYKRRKTVIIMFVMVALFYAPSAVTQVNGLYDTSAPTVYTRTLLDKRISSGRSSTFYYFTVEMESGGEKDIGVSREYYKEREPGDIVTVVERSGLLGIDYVLIDEGE